MKNFIEKILYFLTKQKINTGVINDPRSEEEKAKDWTHEEFSDGPAASSSIYGEKITVSPYPIENQLSTNECIIHALTLCAGIARQTTTGFFVRLSKVFGYRLRFNFPGKGMWLQNAADDLVNIGAPLYSSAPNVDTEEEANRFIVTDEMRTEAKINAPKAYISVKNANQIDVLADIASKGKGIAILIYATRAEWSQTYVQIYSPNLNKDNAEVQHSVTILPKSAFIEDGIKYVTIQDSAWFGGLFLRNVPENFIKARLYGAMYLTDFKYQSGQTTRPIHTFNITKPLLLGMTSPEVVALQQCLQFEGLFPIDQKCTGYYGGMTRAAVKAFQDRYSAAILTPAHVFKPTGDCYTYTLNQLNNLYGKTV